MSSVCRVNRNRAPSCCRCRPPEQITAGSLREHNSCCRARQRSRLSRSQFHSSHLSQAIFWLAKLRDESRADLKKSREAGSSCSSGRSATWNSIAISRWQQNSHWDQPWRRLQPECPNASLRPRTFRSYINLVNAHRIVKLDTRSLLRCFSCPKKNACRRCLTTTQSKTLGFNYSQS